MLELHRNPRRRSDAPQPLTATTLASLFSPLQVQAQELTYNGEPLSAFVPERTAAYISQARGAAGGGGAVVALGVCWSSAVASR